MTTCSQSKSKYRTCFCKLNDKTPSELILLDIYREMDVDMPRSESISKSKKPGPRPTPCMWCGSTECTHCRCSGQNGCSHKKGDMCPNQRYKRRLVCNSCEKNKLKEKQQCVVSNNSKRKKIKASVKSVKGVDSRRPSPIVSPTSESESPMEGGSDSFIQVETPSVVNVMIHDSLTTIGIIPISSKAMTLHDARPFVYKLLANNSISTEFLYINNALVLATEMEKNKSILEITDNQPHNRILYIHLVEKVVSVSAAITRRPNEYSFALPPPLSVQQFTPYSASLMAVPPVQQESSIFPSATVYSQPQSNVMIPCTNDVFSGFMSGMISEAAQSNQMQQNIVLPQFLPIHERDPDMRWELHGTETPVQRMLREARTSGHLDEGTQTAADLGMDDVPRELSSRNNSMFHFGSFDNMFSRHGSMLFPSFSQQGSMLFNHATSTLSIDNSTADTPLLDEIRNLMIRDTDFYDIDKDAPSL